MAVTQLIRTPNLNGDEGTFNDDAIYLFGTQLPNMINQFNTDIALLNLNSVTATSTSSVAIGTGSKTFTIQTGKSFVKGMPVRVASSVTTASYMYGVVDSYSGSTLVVIVAGVSGSGTLASWNVFLSPDVIPYGEGTFTPTFALTTPGTSSFTYVAGGQNGTYTKNGRIINFNIHMQTTAVSVGTGSGALLIAGLPFTSSATQIWYACSVSYAAGFTTNFPTNAMVNGGNGYVGLYSMTSTSASTVIGSVHLGAAMDLYVSGSYIV